MRVRRIAVLLAACVVLTGCAHGDEKPSTLPQVTATPTAVAPSVAPTGIHAPTPQGAAAFARHFYAQIGAAFAESNPELVSRLSAPGCKTCGVYLASLSRLRDRHERVTPVRFDIGFAEAPATDGRTARVDVIFDVGASTRFDSSGKVIYREAAAKRVNETVELVRIGGLWRVSEIR